MDFRHLAALAAPRPLGQDAHELVTLEHVRRALDGPAIGGVAFDGERADARKNLPEQAAGVGKEAVAAHQAHELARPRGNIHAGHVQKRRVVRNDHGAALVLEGAQVLAPVHAVAEQDFEHERHEHVGEVREPVRDLLLVGISAERAVPHLLVAEKQAHRDTPRSAAIWQMRSMIWSMVRPVESSCTASRAGFRGLASREESTSSRRTMSASTCS